MCEKCRKIERENTPEEIANKARTAAYMAELSLKQAQDHMNDFIEYGKLANNVDVLDLMLGMTLSAGLKDRIEAAKSLHEAVEKQTNNPA